MIYQPYTHADRIQAMVGMIRWIYLVFDSPTGGRVLGLLLSNENE